MTRPWRCDRWRWPEPDAQSNDGTDPECQRPVEIGGDPVDLWRQLLADAPAPAAKRRDLDRPLPVGSAGALPRSCDATIDKDDCADPARDAMDRVVAADRNQPLHLAWPLV